MKTTSFFDDIVFYFFLLLVAGGIAFFAYTGINAIKKGPDFYAIQRWCALEGYAWSELHEGHVYCINYTSEPSILLLGDYEELAQERE